MGIETHSPMLSESAHSVLARMAILTEPCSLPSAINVWACSLLSPTVAGELKLNLSTLAQLRDARKFFLRFEMVGVERFELPTS